jgi:uncharacterized protein (DUF697 family)
MDDSDQSDKSSDSNSSNDSSYGTKALEAVQSALSWAYEAALDGLPGMGTLDELVTSYLHEGRTAEDAIDSLIAWQTGKAGTAGFVTGLGGIITLPAAIPANLASVLYIQLRMIAAIAKIRGYDIHSDQVKTLCVACLAGSAVSDILKDVGIKVGTKLTQQAVMKIAGSTLVRINQAVGFRLVTKAGSTGILNLTKMVPFLGGIVGGSFDAVTTRSIAHAAKTVFVTVTLTGPDKDGSAEGADDLSSSS